MALEFPFDPLRRSDEVETLVTRNGKRLYYRFRPAPYYGGIATADAVGCSFLCAYCWNYNRNLYPERFKEFYSPEQAAGRLIRIAKQKAFRLFRISGAEPVLGERTLLHLIDVLRHVYGERARSLFILETNGFFLGCETAFLEKLREFPSLRVRVCLKGIDEESFEKITGAKKEFFQFPLNALKSMERLGIRAWPALMGGLFSSEEIDRFQGFLKEIGIRSDLELEDLEAYPFVRQNMRKRKIRVI